MDGVTVGKPWFHSLFPADPQMQRTSTQSLKVMRRGRRVGWGYISGPRFTGWWDYWGADTGLSCECIIRFDGLEELNFVFARSMCCSDLIKIDFNSMILVGQRLWILWFDCDNESNPRAHRRRITVFWWCPMCPEWWMMVGAKIETWRKRVP